VIVDNNVNWAGRVESDVPAAAAPDDFAYVFLGEGLGAAIISEGNLTRGLVGEIAHLITTGPRGQSMRLIDMFGALRLRQAGSAAVDVRLLLAANAGLEPRAAVTRRTLGRAVSGALAGIAALADPELVIIGGSWGTADRGSACADGRVLALLGPSR